ncbi:MAG: glycosyltransferase family 39 protein, partial [Planctomycetota bacterium]
MIDRSPNLAAHLCSSRNPFINTSRDRSLRRTARDIALLVALCLAVYLPGLFTTPPIDRDEARFAQASRQMLESFALPAESRDTTPFAINTDTQPGAPPVIGGFHAGGLVVPMVQNVPRLNKPPLIYWLQTASAWVFTAGDPLHDAIWMYRVPSVLGSVLAVLATYWIGRRMFAPPVALFAASLLAVSAVVVFDAHQARADQVLLGLTTLSMGLLWSIVRRAKHGSHIHVARWAALWLAVGLGVLVKGVSPVVVLLAILAMGVVGRSWFAWRASKPLLGALIVSAIVLPWAYAVAQKVGFDTYSSILFDETVKRGSQAKEGHVGPPGYHTAFLWAMFWPGSIAALLGIVFAARRLMRWGGKGERWRRRTPGDMRVLFLACWIMPTWLFFEFYVTKLPHYVLPTYPALALLTARAVLTARPRLRLQRIGSALFAVIGVGVATFGIVLVFSMELVQPKAAFIVPSAFVMLVLVAIAARHAWRGMMLCATSCAVLAMLPLVWIVHAGVIPSLTTFSPELVERIDTVNTEGRPIAAMGYHEDSLIFLSRGRIERIVHTDSVDWLAANPDGILLARRLYRDEVGLDHT